MNDEYSTDSDIAHKIRNCLTTLLTDKVVLCRPNLAITFDPKDNTIHLVDRVQTRDANGNLKFDSISQAVEGLESNSVFWLFEYTFREWYRALEGRLFNRDCPATIDGRTMRRDINAPISNDNIIHHLTVNQPEVTLSSILDLFFFDENGDLYDGIAYFQDGNYLRMIDKVPVGDEPLSIISEVYVGESTLLNLDFPTKNMERVDIACTTGRYFRECRRGTRKSIGSWVSAVRIFNPRFERAFLVKKELLVPTYSIQYRVGGLQIGSFKDKNIKNTVAEIMKMV